MNHLCKMVSLLVAVLALPLGCSKDEQPTTPPPPEISSAAFPGNAASLAPGGAPAVGALTGGTAPYSISTAPNAAVATAAISGTNSDTLTITPVGVGTDSVVIKDGSAAAGDSPAGLTLTIMITVSKGGGAGIQGSGVFSVNTSLGNFFAEGVWNENATNGQGVGGVRTTTKEEDFLQVWSYVVHSGTDVDIVAAVYYYFGGTLITGEYPLQSPPFIIPPGGGMFATFFIAFGINPADPNVAYHVATGGTAMLNTLNASSASGTCSGNGIDFTFTSKSFTVNGYGSGSALEKSIQETVSHILRKEIEARKRN